MGVLSIEWLESPTLNDLIRVNDLLNEWNAESNASMLAINHAMGFRTVAEWQSWEIAI
jgi:hypothetical protein